MSELSFEKRTVIKVNLYGQSYELKKPNVRQSMEYNDKFKNCKEDSERLNCLSEFLSGLGMPKDAILEMEMEHLTAITDAIAGSKKK